MVILGAGHAGGTAAALLRQYGHEGPITLVGEEPIPPYQRPPLSKAWLKGEADADSLALKPLEFYAEHDIDFRASTRGAAHRPRRQDRARSPTARRVPYDALILATGARAIALPIPGADLDGVMFLRTAADAEALKATVGPGKRLAVVGGGYIGLEVAASGRALGAEVVVLEREPRHAGPGGLRDAVELLHRPITRRTASPSSWAPRSTGFEGEDGHVTGVTPGRRPHHRLRRRGGRRRRHAQRRDRHATPAWRPPAASWSTSRRAPPTRRSSPSATWPTGRCRSTAACSAWRACPTRWSRPSRPPAPSPAARRRRARCPWHWSDQYDLKLQIAGYAFDVDEILVRGDPATAKFAVFHLKGDLVQSVEAINSPPEFMMGKQLIARPQAGRQARELADPSVSMKEVAA